MKSKLFLYSTLIFIAVIFLFLSTSYSQETKSLTAKQVMEKVDSRNDGDTSISDMIMILIDKKSKQRVRLLKNYNKDYGKDTKGIIFFLSPADVRNTSYLSWDWDAKDKDDDSWLYLPALRRVKRIASGDKSGSFMGSDFSYYDINGIEIKDWDYAYTSTSEMIDGHDTWVIQGKPNAEKKNEVIKETGYLKTLAWVRKDNFMIVKAKSWVKKGKKIKYFRAKDIRKENNIWTAFEVSMVITRQGKKEHSSVIRIQKIIYNSGIEDRMFTTQRMERGL